MLDLFCIYNEIQSVIFDALNYERAQIVLDDICEQTKRGVQPQDIQALGPADVGRMERILQPANIRENIFRGWSGLRVTNSMLKRSLKEQQGEKQEDRRNFVVTLHAQVATLKERLGAAAGIDCDSSPEIRCVPVQGGEEGVKERKIPITLIPQVLLHKNATKEDMLRALVVVHHLLGDFRSDSQSLSLREAVSAGKHSDVDAEELLRVHRLDEGGLTSRLSKAIAFERGAFVHIKRALVVAGWDVDKYMFSSAKNRVEFEDREPE